ncbi:MAG: pseudouridine synthase [Thiohalomonadales bacterium]
MPQLILFNKPFDVLSQFSKDGDQVTLAKFIKIKSVYPAGRLDKTSEGLLLLTNDGVLQHKISHPDHKMEKTYWVQVEGVPTKQALNELTNGVKLKDGLTKKARAFIIKAPEIWERVPPIRFRANIPTTWISLTISEGRNRQVRRMTAAVGIPTLRLIRYSIGPWNIKNLRSGQSQTLQVEI